jgi:hypothetical protein
MAFPRTLFVLLLLAACNRSPEPEPKTYRVAAEAEPFVQAFKAEALKRGVAVALDNLIVEFGPTSGDEVCGQCLLEAGKTPRVTLNPESLCWKGVSAEEKEGLVFHELGHCLLGRQHRTDRLPNGAYASLMNGQDVGVYAICVYDLSGTNGKGCDKRDRRPYYVDELFDPKTPVPTWAK